MYAVVETGGKQYRVAVGETVDVEKIAQEPGETVVLDRVLIVSDEGNVRIGQPVVDGAAVSATVLRHGKGRKVVAFKYKAKERYRRKKGHRQEYTRLRIDDIQA
ncbi:MAG: 50S ribosomal protein L21 [Chloroflexi bacterium]|nr:50S ribosomal protein L21 [Chloroflexota bacterium]